MPLQEHLKELRKRILICVSIIFLFTLVTAPLAPLIVKKVATDLLHGVEFHVFTPQEATLVYLKISLYSAFILSFPVIAWHSWAFIAPGMLKKERKYLLLFTAGSAFLFTSGVIFSYYLMLPIALRFLIDITYLSAIPVFNLNQTLNFILFTTVLFGLIFQLPLVSAMLTKYELIDYKTMSDKRAHVVIISLICAAIVTDPSVFTQILVAVPIIILYEISIIVSRFIGE